MTVMDFNTQRKWRMHLPAENELPRYDLNMGKGTPITSGQYGRKEGDFVKNPDGTITISPDMCVDDLMKFTLLLMLQNQNTPFDFIYTQAALIDAMDKWRRITLTKQPDDIGKNLTSQLEEKYWMWAEDEDFADVHLIRKSSFRETIDNK